MGSPSVISNNDHAESSYHSGYHVTHSPVLAIKKEEMIDRDDAERGRTMSAPELVPVFALFQFVPPSWFASRFPVILVSMLAWTLPMRDICP